MAITYTNTQIQSVKDLIDKYTDSTLDNYVRMGIKSVAEIKMKNKESKEIVADAVFDSINNSFADNATMAAACQQICPRDVLYVLRADIIKALK